MAFKDRREAGRKLAEALERYKNSKDAILLALPRGGVVVADEIAKSLNLPLDIVVPRKIGAPQNPEYAIGSIILTPTFSPPISPGAKQGEIERVWNEGEIEGIDKDWLKKEIEKETKEAQRRLKAYRGEKPPFDLKNKTVILVDDGIATGLTLLAAIKSVKKQNPRKIIVAVPVGAKDSVSTIKKEVDEVICLYSPAFFGAVGSFYEKFGQTSDEEVIEILKIKN
jgi:putative phosphoribosyl transferase